MAFGLGNCNKNYRADIDGLRAVSVLSVLIFHAFPNLLPGGFVGVDIFFVISGYLITKIIINNIESGNIRLFDFYRHRVRRIFPALIIVLLFCLISGWFILDPLEFKTLGKNLSASTIFMLNFSLRKEAGYFDTASDYKPLLHLWSLSIEEQFYLIWPFFLLFSSKLKIPAIRSVIIFIIPSFIFSVLLSLTSPISDFFFPLTRFWEILFGAAFLCLERNGCMQISPAMRSCMSIMGMALLIIALAMFNNTSPYPGWRAVLPVLSGTLLIASGSNACVNRWILSFRPLVLIGVISYPLYLWHWPLLSYARILLDEPPPSAIRTGLLLASIGLAVVTYLLIERPLRFGRHATGKMIGLCIGMAILGLAGKYIQRHHGLPTRYVATHTVPTGWAALERVAPSVEQCTQPVSKTALNWCYTDKRETPHAILIGDSHAEALYWSLANHSRPGHRWMLMGRAACAPMLGMERITSINAAQDKSDPPQCAQANQDRLRYITQTDSIHLILIATAQRVLERDSYAPHVGEAAITNGAFIGLSNLITRLEQAGKTVAFLEDNPDRFGSNKCVPLQSPIQWLNYIGEGRRLSRCTISYKDYLTSSQNYRHLVAELQLAHPSLLVYQASPVLCDVPNNKCERVRNGEVLYSDGDHLSTVGADYIAEGLIKFLNY